MGVTWSKWRAVGFKSSKLTWSEKNKTEIPSKTLLCQSEPALRQESSANFHCESLRGNVRGHCEPRYCVFSAATCKSLGSRCRRVYHLTSVRSRLRSRPPHPASLPPLPSSRLRSSLVFSPPPLSPLPQNIIPADHWHSDTLWDTHLIFTRTYAHT